jgi:hypothetical protein
MVPILMVAAALFFFRKVFLPLVQHMKKKLKPAISLFEKGSAMETKVGAFCSASVSTHHHSNEPVSRSTSAETKQKQAIAIKFV